MSFKNPNQCPLSQDIQREYDRLVTIINPIPSSIRALKVIEGTGGKVSVANLIAYQIGWGKCVIRWYEAGIQGKTPSMPGEGFSSWDYQAIAQHFYQKYHYDGFDEQMEVFHQVVLHLLEIVEREDRSHQLDQPGIWPWCTLSSGKNWPLSKWIRVNTASPYKRAAQLIKKAKWT